MELEILTGEHLRVNILKRRGGRKGIVTKTKEMKVIFSFGGKN